MTRPVVYCPTCNRPEVADVSVTRTDDQFTLNWPDDAPDVTLITRELLEGLIATLNRLSLIRENQP